MAQIKHKPGTPVPKLALKSEVTFCVQGVTSPMLANVYMNRFLKYWRRSERSGAYQAHVVSYAGDFVILSRGHAEEALAWTRQVMTRLGLALNEAKTSIRNARQERFDFPGYTFGPHRYRKDGHWYLGASPSKKSVQRLKQGVGGILVPGNHAPWEEVRDQLNSLLRGWCAYFGYGTRMIAYQAVDNHVYHSVRRSWFAATRCNRKAHAASATEWYSVSVACFVYAAFILARCRQLRGEASRKAGCRKSARPV